jgi:hypothetical protein
MVVVRALSMISLLVLTLTVLTVIDGWESGRFTLKEGGKDKV